MATTGTLELNLRDTNNNAFKKNLPNVNEKYLPPYDSDVTVAQASASLKAAGQALNALTVNTLLTTYLVSRMDVTGAGE